MKPAPAARAAYLSALAALRAVSPCLLAPAPANLAALAAARDAQRAADSRHPALFAAYLAAVSNYNRAAR